MPKLVSSSSLPRPSSAAASYNSHTSTASGRNGRNGPGNGTTKKSAKIQMHNASLFSDLMGDIAEKSQSTAGHSTSESATRGEIPSMRTDASIVLHESRNPRGQRGPSLSRTSRARPKVEVDQHYVPAYARTKPADRKTVPHPQSRKLPDAKKEARRQAAKRMTETQLNSEYQRKQQLAAKSLARDAETAQLVKASMQRKAKREEAEFQAMLKNVRDGQALMGENKKKLDELDRQYEQKREDQYNQWTDDVFMPIQNQIFEVVNNTDYKELSRQRREKMNAFIKASQTDQGVFLLSKNAGHSHKKLVVKKLRDPLKRLLVRLERDNHECINR